MSPELNKTRPTVCRASRREASKTRRRPPLTATICPAHGHGDSTNVPRLFRTLVRDERRIAHYDAGVGTLADPVQALIRPRPV
jgi:hypothetical protein